MVRIGLGEALARYVAEKGSIAVDGMSLTVTGVEPGSFTVSLIPTTLALTTLGHTAVGEPVNLEVDVLAKYVERLLEAAGVRESCHDRAGHPPGPRGPGASAASRMRWRRCRRAARRGRRRRRPGERG